MTKYRVKPGYTYGAFGTFKEGDIVELLEVDAGPFLDKLEIVPSEAPSTPEPEADTETPPDAPAEKPAVKRAAVKPAVKPANG